MDTGLRELLDKLHAHASENDFIDIAYEVIEEIEARDDANEAIGSMLELMERNPTVDFGMPGPLVHFVEKYYKRGYEEKLVDSVRRLPTKHTLWMLNRVINGLREDDRRFFISVLDSVVERHDIGTEVTELANHYKSLHI